MKNIENFKFIFNKLVSTKLGYAKNIHKNLELLETDPYKLIKDPNTEVLFKFRVTEDLCNVFNTMHGGAVSTLIDVTTTIAISGLDEGLRHNVSVDLSTQFINPIKIDSNVFVLCKIPKIGKNITYSYADIFNEDNLNIAAKGTHIKAMLSKSWKNNLFES